MRITTYEDRYRDDMIFMVRQAKDALGRIPTINPDLLDVAAGYPEIGGSPGQTPPRCFRRPDPHAVSRAAFAA